MITLAKLATPVSLGIEVCGNEDYDVIICVYNITDEISLHESNFVGNVVIWPKFGNFSISITAVILTSIP